VSGWPPLKGSGAIPVSVWLGLGMGTAEDAERLPAAAGGCRKIIHIDMDAFYASVEQRDNPELRGKPVAVGGSRERGVVAAASYEARKFGVHSAMPSITAKRKCPDLIFVKPRFDAYKGVSLQIREIFAALHRDNGADTCACRRAPQGGSGAANAFRFPITHQTDCAAVRLRVGGNDAAQLPPLTVGRAAGLSSPV
jgi:hypothetical protein